LSRADAWIITVGNELLRGEIIDSNKAFMADRLLRLDHETLRTVTVPDEPGAIEEVLRDAAARARIVLVSGGLGPTRDDITTEVAARAFGRKIVRDPAALDEIRSFFRSFGREMSPNNEKQADFPEGAEVLPNPRGTAPGFMLEADGALLFFMPGVPRELYRMVDEEVLPRISERLDSGTVVRAALLRTFGLGESTLDRGRRSTGSSKISRGTTRESSSGSGPNFRTTWFVSWSAPRRRVRRWRRWVVSRTRSAHVSGRSCSGRGSGAWPRSSPISSSARGRPSRSPSPAPAGSLRVP
jgi:nicotinamide-nucleotide amidase